MKEIEQDNIEYGESSDIQQICLKKKIQKEEIEKFEIEKLEIEKEQNQHRKLSVKTLTEK